MPIMEGSYIQIDIVKHGLVYSIRLCKSNLIMESRPDGIRLTQLLERFINIREHLSPENIMYPDMQGMVVGI